MYDLISKVMVWGALTLSLIGIGTVLYTEEKPPKAEPVQKTVTAEEASKAINNITAGLKKLNRE